MIDSTGGGIEFFRARDGDALGFVILSAQQLYGMI